MARQRGRMTEREAKNETRLIYIVLAAFVIVVVAVLYLYFHGEITPNGSTPVQ